MDIEDEAVRERAGLGPRPVHLGPEGRTWVTDAYEVLVEHEPHWFLKEPPLPPLPHVEGLRLDRCATRVP
ncbi:hypothetical protein CJ030_MR1G029378 [Morella rubra]|uniref:Uncharacterized protein n=1 Tax=Morella rubra TaxID=262757 RepID=A0A6A1WPQ4_9ROSI|nr:hypothetical protein CJ030_MR1G029378 [Morella rubra]